MSENLPPLSTENESVAEDEQAVSFRESVPYRHLLQILRPLPQESPENREEKETLLADLEQITNKEDLSFLERKIKAQLMLNTIPAELARRQKIQEELWDAEDKEQLEQIIEKTREVIRLRRGSVLSAEYLQKHPEDVANIHDTIDHVREYSMESENIIGEGENAWIYEDTERKDVCAKMIKNLSATYEHHGNGPAQELGFLDELADFEVDGVRTPFPYAYISDPGIHAIIMERLNAVSIGDLARKRIALPRPEEFDVDAFAASVFRYFKELHAHNVIHGCPHEDNIMIDFETHKPRIIDFGLAKRVIAFGDEEEKFENEKKTDLTQLAKAVELLRQWKAKMLTNNE